MQLDPKVLRQRVFECEVCAGDGFGFSSVSPGTPLAKFPPTIGSSLSASLLFVGTNPRISSTNRDLFLEIMRDSEAFDLLAKDVWRGSSYLKFGEPGRHYDLHLAIAGKAFPGQPFASVAAVTELFLCASKDAGLLPTNGSKCADLHLDEVVQQICPQVVVTVGARAQGYLSQKRISTGLPFKAQLGGRIVVVAPVPHPAAWGGQAPTRRHIDWAADVTRITIDGGTNFPEPPPNLDRSCTQAQLAAWLIHSNPTIGAGQLTRSLAAAFPPPIYKVGPRHGPHYLSLYRTGKLSVPASDPRDR
jgi:uracil-DNA glycosylase